MLLADGSSTEDINGAASSHLVNATEAAKATSLLLFCHFWWPYSHADQCD